MRVPAQLEIARELVDAQVTLRLVGSVATDAMLGQEGFKRFRSTGGTRQAKAGSEEQTGTGKKSAMEHRSCQYELGQDLAHHFTINIR